MDSTPMSVRDAKKTEKKKRIEAAAIQVMARNGYDRTTVSQIARAAGVADGTIYLYFENKDDLLLKTIDEITERFIQDGIKILATKDSPIECLRLWARLHLENLGSDENLACIFQIELRHNVRLMKRFSETKLRTYFKCVEGYIRKAQQQGQIREGLDPWLAAKILFGALDEAATNWVLSNKDYELAAMADPTLDILLNGMLVRN